MSKIEEAIEIITALGFPRAQQNERSGLSLLALVNLKERGSWQTLDEPLLGVRAILDFCRNSYSKPYAENSRESFRKETLHQFVSGGLALQNPDQPSRPPNSPKWNYQIAPQAKLLLTTYKTDEWEKSLAAYLAIAGSLAEKYKAVRNLAKLPCVLEDGTMFELSPGGHSELIRDIVQEFAPRFAPGSQILYLGDTGLKGGGVMDLQALEALGVPLHERGKMPDAILYLKEKNWLYLIESVTSVGPVDGKRHAELSHLFRNSTAGLVYVTAFPSRQLMARFFPDIAWETEVWCSDDPTHLIHFNGDRFLGPH